jgi:GGDEF domain-containing protein
MLRGNDIIGRWDKFTFALLLPSTPGEPAARTLERIRQVLTEAVILDVAREPVKLLPRAGLACFTEPGLPSALIQQAEAALENSRQTSHSTVLYTSQKEG